MNGVMIQRVDVSNLETRFETFNVNVNNAVPKKIKNMNKDNLDMNNMNIDNDEELIVKFQRLTNKPFDIKMNVFSDKTRDAIVRVFIGPKYDSNGQRFTLPQASRFFVQLDQFKVKLHNGENVIERNSQESNVNVHNPLSIKQLWNRVEQGQMDFNQGNRQVLGLLKHAQLPKGKKSGQQFVMYIIINDIDNMNMKINNEESSEMDMDNTMNGRTNINDKILKHVRDHRSIGFPLDRPSPSSDDKILATPSRHHKQRQQRNDAKQQPGPETTNL